MEQKRCANPNCNKLFIGRRGTQRFCSSSCRILEWYSTPKHGIVVKQRICEMCGEEFIVRSQVEGATVFKLRCSQCVQTLPALPSPCMREITEEACVVCDNKQSVNASMLTRRKRLKNYQRRVAFLKDTFLEGHFCQNCGRSLSSFLVKRSLYVLRSVEAREQALVLWLAQCLYHNIGRFDQRLDSLVDDSGGVRGRIVDAYKLAIANLRSVDVS